MKPLSNTLAQEYLTHSELDLTRRIRGAIYNEITFSGHYKSCCVGIVDAVNSTNITAKLPNEKLCAYYSIFLNSMAVIAKEFGAVVIKNIGDSLLYYFPNTAEGHSKSAFKDTLECGMAMLEANPVINKIMQEESLPYVSYRVSADYGSVMVAKSLNSSNDDIFGSTVNLCSKMNSKAVPNSVVIGGDLQQIVKNFEGYAFNLMSSHSTGMKLDYPIYSIVRSTSKRWF